MVKNKVFKVFVLLLCVINLTSCYDVVELESRGFVISTGIDKIKDDEENKNMTYPNRYIVTLAIPKLSDFSTNDSSTESRIIKVNKCQTVPGGMLSITDNTSQRLDYSHTKLIIFGKEILQDKLLFKEALDGLERVPKISRQLITLSTNGNASDIFNADTGNESLVGMFVYDFYKNNNHYVATTFKQDLEQLIDDLEFNGCSVMPQITSKDEKLYLSGAALIKDYSLVGFLSSEDISNYLFLISEAKGVELLTYYKDILLKCRVLGQKSKINFVEENNNLKMIINVKVEGQIEEYIITEEKIYDEATLKLFGGLFEQEINIRIKEFMDILQKDYKTDFLQIEDDLYRYNYDLWEKYNTNWQEVYENMQIEINSEVNIKSLGITK